MPTGHLHAVGEDRLITGRALCSAPVTLLDPADWTWPGDGPGERSGLVAAQDGSDGAADHAISVHSPQSPQIVQPRPSSAADGPVAVTGAAHTDAGMRGRTRGT